MFNSTVFGNIHVVGVALLFIALLLGGFCLFQNIQNKQPNFKLRKFFIAVQHLALTLLIITGIALLVLKNLQVETWFYAKIILFLVMVSSLIKAFKKDETILLVQRRAGWVIASVAFIAIYVLVFLQPSF